MPLLHEVAAVMCCEDIELPVLSVVIPACNEASHIGQALRSLLDQDYPKLEVVVINDRSTDDTGEILERLADRDNRIKVIHIDKLPAGWLGKVHALHQGVKQATGEWYLFTDADIYFQPGALRRSVCYAKHYRLNHLACVPDVHNKGFWLDIAVRSFFLMLCLGARVAEVNRENSNRPIGIGAFNLVEAATFHNTPGFEWLRMETVDDYGLGVMIKQAGGRTRLVVALKDMSVPWYENLGAMIKGVEKNTFGAAAKYSLARLFLIELFLLGLVMAPLVSLISGLIFNDPLLLMVACVFFAALVVFALYSPRQHHREMLAYLWC